MHRSLQTGTRWSDRIGVLDADPELFEAERVAWQRPHRAVRLDRDAHGLMRAQDLPSSHMKDSA